MVRTTDHISLLRLVATAFKLALAGIKPDAPHYSNEHVRDLEYTTAKQDARYTLDGDIYAPKGRTDDPSERITITQSIGPEVVYLRGN